MPGMCVCVLCVCERDRERVVKCKYACCMQRKLHKAGGNLVTLTHSHCTADVPVAMSLTSRGAFVVRVKPCPVLLSRTGSLVICNVSLAWKFWLDRLLERCDLPSPSNRSLRKSDRVMGYPTGGDDSHEEILCIQVVYSKRRKFTFCSSRSRFLFVPQWLLIKT